MTKKNSKYLTERGTAGLPVATGLAPVVSQPANGPGQAISGFRHGESGMALIETVVALGILGIAAVGVVGGLNGAQKAAVLAEAQATAGSLAQSQMEQVKQAPYVTGAASYAAAPLPVGADYNGYGATIGATPVNISDDGIQQVTITVTRDGEDVLILRGYKANR